MSLSERTADLHRRLREFPEAGKRGEETVLKKDAWLALLDLRQLLEREVLPALRKLERIEADTVEIECIELSKGVPVKYRKPDA